jgi:VanZ family protein
VGCFYAVFAAILNGIILGGGTEIIQYFFIPGRLCSVYDFIANVAGCFLGCWLFNILGKRKIENIKRRSKD